MPHCSFSYAGAGRSRFALEALMRVASGPDCSGSQTTQDEVMFGDVARMRTPSAISRLYHRPRSWRSSVTIRPLGSSRDGAAPNRVQIALPVHDAME
jgi:hypothetical protein